MIKTKCPNCGEEIEIRRRSYDKNHKDYLSGSKLWLTQIVLTLCSLLISVLLVMVLVLLIKIPISYPVAIALSVGFLLNLARAYWKDRVNRRYQGAGRDIKEKYLHELCSTYVLNYPIFLIVAYLLLVSLGVEFFVIPFLVGWSVDYLWGNGNLFSRLKNIFK